MKPLLIRNIAEMKNWRKNQTGSIGFVPTMGALHNGHGTLMDLAAKENTASVLSIFVNKTQFNNQNDFDHYPSTWEADQKLAEEKNISAIFAPTYEDLYPDQYRYRLSENELSHNLCGAHRPGHFDGVLSVVMKLFQIVQPTRAYFGEKDFQQLQLIKGMVQAYFLDLEIVPVPTVREHDGLAMSSRNLRLTQEQRKRAPELFQILQHSPSASEASRDLEMAGFRVDYVTDLNGRRFAAAYLGEVRLIDNVGI